MRLPILSKYKDLGTVVEGKVEQGTISVGDKLWMMPNRTPVEVIQLHLDQDEVRTLPDLWRVLAQGSLHFVAPPSCLEHILTYPSASFVKVGYLVGGENARVKLKDISDEDIQPGFVLSPRGELAVKAVRKFEVNTCNLFRVILSPSWESMEVNAAQV